MSGAIGPRFTWLVQLHFACNCLLDVVIFFFDQDGRDLHLAEGSLLRHHNFLQLASSLVKGLRPRLGTGSPFAGRAVLRASQALFLVLE